MSHSKQKPGGSFRERKEGVLEIAIKDLANPWNFYNLFLQDDETVFQWLRYNGLLASTIKCPKCSDLAVCRIKKMSSKSDGYTFRCPNNASHVYYEETFMV